MGMVLAARKRRPKSSASHVSAVQVSQQQKLETESFRAADDAHRQAVLSQGSQSVEHGTPDAVSKALHSAKLELESQLLQTDRELRSTETQLERAREEKSEKEKELDREDRFYKVQNWGIWSNYLKNLRA